MTLSSMILSIFGINFIALQAESLRHHNLGQRPMIGAQLRGHRPQAGTQPCTHRPVIVIHVIHHIQ